MSWMSEADTRAGLLAEMPVLADHFQQLYQSLWTLPQLPATTLELCRLRLAQLHSSDTEWQRRELDLSDDQYRDLSEWHKTDSFDDGERACLAFTEVYAMDVQAITDEQAEAVKQSYGDAGLVALVEALGIFDGMTRMSLLWGLSAEGKR